MINFEFLQRSTAQINATSRAAAIFFIYELLVDALAAKCVQALGEGGGVAEEAVAERAREARRERRALHPHDVPCCCCSSSSSVPFRARRRGVRGALGHGAAHA